MAIGIHPDMNGVLTAAAQCVNREETSCGQGTAKEQDYGSTVDTNSAPAAPNTGNDGVVPSRG